MANEVLRSVTTSDIYNKDYKNYTFSLIFLSSINTINFISTDENGRARQKRTGTRKNISAWNQEKKGKEIKQSGEKAGPANWVVEMEWGRPVGGA